jgi:spermidine/putrescine transport system permease protein
MAAEAQTIDPLAQRARVRVLASLLPAPAMVTVFLVIPLLLIIAYSFMDADGFGGVRMHFSTDAYTQLLYDRQLDDSLAFTDAYLSIAWRSACIAFFTTVLTVVIGLPVALYIALQPAEKRSRLLLLVTIPFWTNILVRTYAWILMLRDTGVVNTVLMALGVTHEPLPMLYTNGAVLVGLVYTYAPFMVLPIYACLEKMDVRLIEAAHDLYATKWQALRMVVWPAAKPGVIAGCMLTFIPCLGAMIAPELLGGGRKMMLGNLIYRQFTDARNWPFGSVLAVVLLVLIGASAGILSRARAKREGGAA